MCVCVCVCVGGRTGALLLEQRVHHESDRGELQRHPAHHVRQPVQDLQRTLEPVSHRLTPGSVPVPSACLLTCPIILPVCSHISLSCLLTCLIILPVCVRVQGDRSAGVQRSEGFHGDEQHLVRRTHGHLQVGPPAVNSFTLY